MGRHRKELIVKVIRGYQVINRDGTKVIMVTYNEVDDSGKVTSENQKESFYAVDAGLNYNLTMVEDFIRAKIG